MLGVYFRGSQAAGVVFVSAAAGAGEEAGKAKDGWQLETTAYTSRDFLNHVC